MSNENVTENEIVRDYMVEGNNNTATNLFGETEQEIENRRILQEAERKAKAKAYMSRKEEEMTPTERMLRDAANRGQAKATQADNDFISYQHHLAQKELAKAQQIATGEPLNEAQWNEIEKSDFKFYLSDAAKEIRSKHRGVLGLSYYGK